MDYSNNDISTVPIDVLQTARYILSKKANGQSFSEESIQRSLERAMHNGYIASIPNGAVEVIVNEAINNNIIITENASGDGDCSVLVMNDTLKARAHFAEVLKRISKSTKEEHRRRTWKEDKKRYGQPSRNNRTTASA